jgi:hypothetical protein
MMWLAYGSQEIEGFNHSCDNAIDVILLHSLQATFDNKISPSDCANISEYQLGTKTSSTTTI